MPRMSLVITFKPGPKAMLVDLNHTAGRACLLPHGLYPSIAKRADFVKSRFGLVFWMNLFLKIWANPRDLIQLP